MTRAAWITEQPDKPGWYAVLICYDPAEGSFPAGVKWDGKMWAGPFGTDAPVVARLERTFDDGRAASEWAYEHDPDTEERKGDKR